MKLNLSWSMGRGERVTLAVLGMVIVAAMLIAISGYKEATRDPVVAEYRVASAPAGTKPIRIALVTDTHMGGPVMSIDAARLRALVEKVRDLRPDMIVLGGDYAGSENGFDAAVAQMATLAAPLGVVAVLGNHDYEGGRTAAGMAATLRRANIIPLVNDHVDVGPVVVAGLDDLWKGSSDIGEAGRAVADARGRPVILVSHNPDVFPGVPAGVSLTLAGHTHGSHAVFPVTGPIVSSSKFGQRYRRGHIVEKGRDMIVSSGAGGIAFRWNVPPEIALITLEPRRR